MIKKAGLMIENDSIDSEIHIRTIFIVVSNFFILLSQK